jgi:hypothetical protein
MTKNSIYDLDINVGSVSFNAYLECRELLHHNKNIFLLKSQQQEKGTVKRMASANTLV